jgi:response regulator RpfG family c-di-GMP phosphodiesterase
MPDINGFELCQKILELDVNVRVCFITAGEVNIEALREVYPNVSLGCFIKKPVSIDYLIKRLSAELVLYSNSAAQYFLFPRKSTIYDMHTMQ